MQLVLAATIVGALLYALFPTDRKTRSAEDLTSDEMSQPVSSREEHPPSVINNADTPTVAPLVLSGDSPAIAQAPFNAQEAQRSQEAWAAYLQVPIEYENAIGMRFRLIPPGEFVMGTSEAEIANIKSQTGENDDWHKYVESESPPHTVRLTRAFYLGMHEVTRGQYAQVTGENDSEFAPTLKEAEIEDTSSLPIERVSWDDASDFCVKLSQHDEGVWNYRLPTEAEWEFASRAGTTTHYWSGDNDTSLSTAGWFGFNSKENGKARTHPVGQLDPNPFGIHDILGNVLEWCQDVWSPDSYERYQGTIAIDPFNGGDESQSSTLDEERVTRGGFFHNPTILSRSSCRRGFRQSYKGNFIGFRIVAEISTVRAK